MILSFRHRGLKRLYDRDDRSKIGADLVERVVDTLALLDVAVRPQDLDLPGLCLHRLKGDLKGFWSVTLSGNRRLIFRIEDGDAYDVDPIDYQ